MIAPPGVARAAWRKALYQAAKQAANLGIALANDARGADLAECPAEAADWRDASKAHEALAELLLTVLSEATAKPEPEAGLKP